MMVPRPFTILLAEDDDGHAALVQRNLRRVGVTNAIVRVTDGQAVLDHVHGNLARLDGKAAETLLILLDINMPRVDGIEVLRHLKNDPATSQIPVIILTTTDSPKDVEMCYQLGCSVYVTKPVLYEQFVEAVRRLGLFLQVVELPGVRDKRKGTLS